VRSPVSGLELLDIIYYISQIRQKFKNGLFI